MFDDYADVAAENVEVSHADMNSNKVMSLQEAVSRFVKPGMHLHFAHFYAKSTAALNEVLRQFWGKDPGFTVSALGFIGNLVILFYGGLVKKAISTYFGDSYPMPGPNPIYQEAYKEGTVDMEHWTILSFAQRMLAGSFNLEFMSTKSLFGTSIAEENQKRGNYFEIETPGGGKMGMVRALNPDITIGHGWAADTAGNVICSPPYSETTACVKASREGAIMTVEEIVSTDFIRRYSNLVKVPSYMVKAVCPAPFGTHPGGISNFGLEEEFMGYEIDRDFLIDLRKKCRNKKELKEWVDWWVLGCEDHDEYVKKLGHQKIWYLYGKSSRDSWKSELADALVKMNHTPEYNPTEMMIAAGARVIADKARKESYRTILAGVGASNLAAWLAYYELMKEGHDVDLMAEIGFFGYSPQPADPYIFNLRNVPNCRMLTDVYDVLGSFVGGPTSQCIGSLGAGEVDKHGNINSTEIPEYKLFLVGSGGAADVGAGAKEIVMLVEHSKFRLVENVPYVTCPGDKVSTVVTTMGILEKRGEELVLTAYFPTAGEDEDSAVSKIKEECGWELGVADELEKIDAPTLKELKSIRMFDPHRYFIGED